MKILFFSYRFNPEIGGIESISEMLANYFFCKGHEVHLITTTKNTNAANFPFKILSSPIIFTTIKELKWADIVFENNPCFSISYPNFFMRKPSVISLQTWLTENNGGLRLRQILKKFLLRSADRVVACSKAVKESYPKAIIINNPYNEQLFKRTYNVDKIRDFIFLGRLVSDKGADIAIKAFFEVLKQHPTSSFTIVGDGEEMPFLQNLVKLLNIEQQVIFKGKLQGKALVNCLNEHKFLLVPSTWKEPFGIVALEGIACGCIPIVADGGGLPEAVGTLGLVFSRGKIEKLKDCMLKVISNKPAHEISPEAIQHLKNYRIPTIADKYLKVFESVI